MSKLEHTVSTSAHLSHVAWVVLTSWCLLRDTHGLLATLNCHGYSWSLNYRMLVEGFWRIVLQKVAGHWFHQFDNLCLCSIITEDLCYFDIEVCMMKQAFEQTIVFLFQSFNQVLKYLKFFEADLLLVLIWDELVTRSQEVWEETKLTECVKVKAWLLLQRRHHCLGNSISEMLLQLLFDKLECHPITSILICLSAFVF